MKHEPIIPANFEPLAPVVTVLECPSILHLDPAPLSALFAQKGETAAEDTVCRVLEDLAHRLNELQGPRRRGAFDEIFGPADRFAVIADQIGLMEVATAARHVATTARQADGVALEATMGRLERAFDSAISQVWNFNVML